MINTFIEGSIFLSIICFGLGFLLVVVEMFHPGFGVPGIMGSILLILGVIFTAKSILEAFVMIVIIIAILAAVLTLVLQSVTKGKLSKSPLILSHSQKKETGYIGTEDLNYFVGKEGITLSILRPSGIADFDGVKLDVVSEGEFISKEIKIVVIKVEGRRIVVRQK